MLWLRSSTHQVYPFEIQEAPLLSKVKLFHYLSLDRCILRSLIFEEPTFRYFKVATSGPELYLHEARHLGYSLVKQKSSLHFVIHLKPMNYCLMHIPMRLQFLKLQMEAHLGIALRTPSQLSS